MRIFRSRQTRANEESLLDSTEQAPHPAVLSALVACKDRAKRAVQTTKSKIAQRFKNRRLNQWMREKSRVRDDVSIEDLAVAARLSQDVDAAATSVQKSLPPMRAHLDGQAHEYGADPMIWTRTRHGSFIKPPLDPAPRAGGLRWIMNFFF